MQSRVEDLTPRLRRIMDRKERGELLEDLRLKNRELQESLENLRRTTPSAVASRTN